VNLAAVGAITARASSGNVGGKIEFRSGSPTGELFASIEVPNTGGWDKWIEPKVTLNSQARTDVYAVFINPGKGGLMNLDWVQFDGK
jgi:cytochrome c